MKSKQEADKAVNMVILADTLTVGGAEQLLLELLRGIDRQRFKVMLCLLGEPGIIGREIISQGFDCQSNIGRGRIDFFAIGRLKRIFTGRKPDILLLINHRNCLFYGIPAARLAKVPAIINWQNETGRSYSLHRLTMLCRRLLLKKARTIIAAAQGHRDYVAAAEGIDPKKITVIYNGVDPQKFFSALTAAEAKGRLGIAPHHPVVGIVAALRPDKAHEVFLDAAARVLTRLPETQFLLVGDGPRRQLLEELADRLGISGAVHFLGFRRDTPEVLRAMDVFCLSSRPQQETLSVAALEAMAAGLPVVATRVGFLHEIVHAGKTGYLVPVDDPQALTDALCHLLLDDTLCRNMGDNARAMVEETFSLRQMVASFEHLFAKTRQATAQRGWPCAE